MDAGKNRGKWNLVLKPTDSFYDSSEVCTPKPKYMYWNNWIWMTCHWQKKHFIFPLLVKDALLFASETWFWCEIELWSVWGGGGGTWNRVVVFGPGRFSACFLPKVVCLIDVIDGVAWLVLLMVYVADVIYGVCVADVICGALLSLCTTRGCCRSVWDWTFLYHDL